MIIFRCFIVAALLVLLPRITYSKYLDIYFLAFVLTIAIYVFLEIAFIKAKRDKALRWQKREGKLRYR